MPDFITEDQTTAFPCPVCEARDPEGRWARKVDDYFVCNTCRTRYRNRHEANRIRAELAVNS